MVQRKHQINDHVSPWKCNLFLYWKNKSDVAARLTEQQVFSIFALLTCEQRRMGNPFHLTVTKKRLLDLNRSESKRWEFEIPYSRTGGYRDVSLSSTYLCFCLRSNTISTVTKYVYEYSLLTLITCHFHFPFCQHTVK